MPIACIPTLLRSQCCQESHRVSDYKVLSSLVESLRYLQRTQNAALLARAAQPLREKQGKAGGSCFLNSQGGEARDTRGRRG